MLKLQTFEKEQEGKFIEANGEARFYKNFLLHNQEAVVEFSSVGIALYEDFESDEQSFLGFNEWKEQYNESMEQELKKFIYCLQDGCSEELVREEIVSESVFKNMMKTFMLYKAYMESANQYHWLKLLLKRTKQLIPEEEASDRRGDFEEKISRYLPNWTDVYTGGGIYVMQREFLDKKGNTVLVVLTDLGACIYKETEESDTFLTEAEYDKLEGDVVPEPLVYEANQEELNAYDVFGLLDAKEIEAADKLFQLITEF